MTGRRKQMEADGWTRKSVATEPRLSEIVALYEEIGYEVRLEPLDEQEDNAEPKCRDCLEADPDRVKVIYTRLKSTNAE